MLLLLQDYCCCCLCVIATGQQRHKRARGSELQGRGVRPPVWPLCDEAVSKQGAVARRLGILFDEVVARRVRQEQWVADALNTSHTVTAGQPVDRSASPRVLACSV